MKNKILMIITLALIISSCKDDSDGKVSFIGNWQADETSQVFGRSLYSVAISEDGSSNKVKLANFYQFGNNDFCTADLSGNYITIPTQYFCDHTINGRGEIDEKSTTIIWNYTVVGAGRTDSCSAIYTKKQ